MASKIKARDRLKEIQNICAQNKDEKNLIKFFDSIKSEAMTEEELQAEIERSAQSMGNIGKI